MFGEKINMKIGILTITPNIGYGGIMQAFALKSVIESLQNTEVEIISYKPKYSLKEKIYFFIRGIYKIICYNQ